MLLKKLAERLPKVASDLSDDPTDAVWENRLSCLHETWLWLRADRWLKQQLDPRHFEYLQGERKSLQEHIQGTMVKLTLSEPEGPDEALQNVYGRLVELRAGAHLQLVYRHARKAVTKK